MLQQAVFINKIRMLQRTSATTNERCNEQFLSIKSECYNEHRCYKERGGILSIMGSTIIVFTGENFFMLFMCVKLFILLIREISH